MSFARGIMPGCACVAALLAAGTASVPVAAQADRAFPAKPVRLLVGVAPGGGTDFAARVVSQKLSEAWGQSVVVDNRTGATGLIAMELASKAAADGYTLIVFNVGHMMAGALSRKNPVDPLRDLTPVSLLANGTLMMAVHPAVPAKSLDEFVKHVRATPGRMSYASGGNGSTQHLSAELLKREAKLDIVHVPYKGSGPGMLDLLAGQVQMSITSTQALLGHVRSGKLRALAVTTPKRNPSVPEVPTFAELGYPGVNVSLWQGLSGPPKMPAALVERIAQSAATAVQHADVKEKFAREGGDPVGSSAKEFADFLRQERDKWQRLAKEASITIE
jgi:tripartite-type tricarboxylate transporter receptor subunit TctC